MLSRVAVRQASVISQVLRPCIATKPQRSFSLVEAKDKFAWHRNAWPAWQMYKDKAGSSGSTMMFIGGLAYIFGNEIMVMNEEIYLLAIQVGVGYQLTKAIGPSIGKMFNDQRMSILDGMNQGKNNELVALKKQIAAESEGKEAIALRGEFFDIIKANNEMSLEAEYRSRLHEVENEVKKRLDYQIDVQELDRHIEEEHIANWIESKVVASITPKQESNALAQCIKDLNSLAVSKPALM